MAVVGVQTEEPADSSPASWCCSSRPRRQRLDLPDDPAIFTRLAVRDGGEEHPRVRRRAAGAVGIISAVGALGGFVIPFVYKFAEEEYGSIVPALQAYVLVFLALSVLTWAVYVRRGATMSRV